MCFNTRHNYLSKLAQPGFRSRPGGGGCCAKVEDSLGEGFFDYSAGVPRDGVEKTSFGMKNCTLLIEKYNIGAQNRKWTISTRRR